MILNFNNNFSKFMIIYPPKTLNFEFIFILILRDLLEEFQWKDSKIISTVNG
jgi:hypothetical protein